jgi:hypothetical protein
MHRHPGKLVPRPRSARRPFPLLAFAALLLLLSVTPSVLANTGGAVEAGRLGAVLTRSTRLLERRLRPPASRLARELPGEAKRLAALREPASTTQDQIGIALGELRQVSALAGLDPHYLPALLAAGRAFVAVSGKDPLTGTTIDPEYTGLAAELAASEAALTGLAGDAGKAGAAVKRLTRELSQARRHVRRLERRLRTAGAGARRR